MADGAGSDGHRTMHGLLLERGTVVTAETKFGLILADSEKEPVGSPVRVVAGDAIAILDRGMDHPHFAHRIMALVTERRSLLDQSETFAALDGMLRPGLHMAGEALPIGCRLVAMGEIADGCMAVSGQA